MLIKTIGKMCKNAMKSQLKQLECAEIATVKSVIQLWKVNLEHQLLVSSFYFCYSHASMLIKTMGKTCKICNEKPATIVGMCQPCYGKEHYAAKKGNLSSSAFEP